MQAHFSHAQCGSLVTERELVLNEYVLFSISG